MFALPVKVDSSLTASSWNFYDGNSDGLGVLGHRDVFPVQFLILNLQIEGRGVPVSIESFRQKSQSGSRDIFVPLIAPPFPVDADLAVVLQCQDGHALPLPRPFPDKSCPDF